MICTPFCFFCFILLPKDFSLLGCLSGSWSFTQSFSPNVSTLTLTCASLDLGGHDTLAKVQILEGLSKASGTSSGSIQYEIVGESADMTAKLTPWAHIIKLRKVDSTESLSGVNLEKESYDVIIADDSDISRKEKRLTSVRSLLKTGGNLILFQNQHDRYGTSMLPLAALPSWWAKSGNDCDPGANGKTNTYPTIVIVVLIETILR